jgi:hypothetical protein
MILSLVKTYNIMLPLTCPNIVGYWKGN